MTNNAQTMTSTVDRSTIDRLVREVLRRLMATTNNQQAIFDEKVVTVAMIERLLPAQKTLQVRSGAIVTPAARDEARQRGISIQAASPSPAQQLTPAPTNQPAAVSDSSDPDRAASIASQLARRGVAMPSTSVLLSETPGRDVYEQCSRRGQRAVMVTSLGDVDRFAAELTPTCWVLDMTKLNFMAATNTVARIAQMENSNR